jgi:hypothetical protein
VLYEVLFGQKQGPRIGSFVALYGVDNFIALIRRTLVPTNQLYDAVRLREGHVEVVGPPGNRSRL